jgi:hypothetical protein
MKTMLLVLLLAVAGAAAGSFEERMADAIFVSEGGSKAKVPYGILSCKVKDQSDARRICIRSIENNIKRWEAANRPCDFVTWMARRWTPISHDPNGHINWIKNVNSLLKKYGAQPPQ